MVESSSLIRLKVKDDDKVPCYSVLQQKGVDGAGQGFIGLIHRRTGSYFPREGGRWRKGSSLCFIPKKTEG